MLQCNKTHCTGEYLEVNQFRHDIDVASLRLYLVPAQLVPVKELVRGLIAASADDAAFVMAERVGGSLAGFEPLMNEAAPQLGMKHTHYSTPSGVTTPGNYSTARDLSPLALRLTKDFPEYYAFSSEQHFAFGKFEKRNKNWLLGKDPSVDGMKTGHTQEAAASLLNKVLAWPKTPVFTAPFLVGLLGCFFLFIKNFPIGLVLFLAAVLYGFFHLTSFEKKRVLLAGEIADANIRFDSLVAAERHWQGNSAERQLWRHRHIEA